MPTQSPKTYLVQGVRIDALTMDEAAATIVQRATSRHQPACYVVKPYVEFMDQASRSPHLARLLNQSWLSLPDAVSLQWATTFLYGGKPSLWRVIKLGAAIVLRPATLRNYIPEKFGGSVFTWRLLEQCEQAGAQVYLIGSPKGGSIAITRSKIEARLPQIKIVGTRPGSLSGKSGPGLLRILNEKGVEAELVKDLISKRPDIILVGMGFPIQEEIMAKVAPQLKHGILIGEGGTFDYDSFGGVRRKAPQTIQRSGLEWLWRLMQEPSRIRRQLAIPRFIWSVYRSTRKR